MRAGTCYMAKGSQRGSRRGALSASRGGRANRQSSIRFGWPRQAAEGKRLMVTGQFLDVSSPGIVGRDVQITLSNHRGNVMHTVTNQFGEFRGELENTGDLELSFPGQGEKSIVISLRNALGNLPGRVVLRARATSNVSAIGTMGREY